MAPKIAAVFAFSQAIARMAQLDSTTERTQFPRRLKPAKASRTGTNIRD
jgi:hypothetical protein